MFVVHLIDLSVCDSYPCWETTCTYVTHKFSEFVYSFFVDIHTYSRPSGYMHEYNNRVLRAIF
jgi:hypothetical protein